MSTSIRGVVEYQDISVPTIQWDLGEVFFPSTYSNIQGYLGMWADEGKKSLVPLRGYPKDGYGSTGVHRVFTALVVRGQVSSIEHEVDGATISEAEAERWLNLGAVWLDDEWHGEYRRISDVDMRGVNWITADEYEKVLDRVMKDNPKTQLGTHRAVLASMRSLESDGYKGVRFVYGGS